MAFDILLILIFLASAASLGYILSQWLPRLVAIPDEVITDHLHAQSAKFQLFLLNFKTFYRERKIQQWFWRFLMKVLQKFHILILKLDNGMTALIRIARTHGGNGGDAEVGGASPAARVSQRPRVIRLVREIRTKPQ